MSQKFLGNFSIIDHSFHRHGKGGERGETAARADEYEWASEWILFYFNMTKSICNMISIFMFIFFAFIYSMYRKLARWLSMWLCVCLSIFAICTCMFCVSVCVSFYFSFLLFVTSQTHLQIYFAHHLIMNFSNVNCFANNSIPRLSKNIQTKIEWCFFFRICWK